ncbi:hypothetical protein JCM11251_005550 [Rhodosporidiobolus azoricus]
MATRTLLASSFRSVPSSRPTPNRTLFTSAPRAYAPPPDREDAHGSVTSSRKLRPRDRLQFIEASEQQQAKEAAALASQEPAAGASEEAELEQIPLASAGAAAAFSSSSSIPSSPSATPSLDDPPHPSSSSEYSDPTTGLIINPPVAGLPPLPRHNIPVSRNPFSTHRFVRKLVDEGKVPRGMAEELMKATKSMLIRDEGKAREELLSRQDLENEAYLFTAALKELRTGSQVKSRNDGITLKSLTASLQREVDAVEQKMKEDMQRLSSDIQLDMNTRKEETGQELQGLDQKVMDLNSKFTILLSEVRTEIEATKWISTRRVMTAIVILVVTVVATFSSRSATKKSSSSQSSSDHKNQPLSIEELGVQVQPGLDEAEVLPDGTPVSRGWAYWTGQLGGQTGVGMGQTQGKRVGEEEEHS